MTRAAFGRHLDLHAGGVDLAFPHHENEIAQWRGRAGRVFEGASDARAEDAVAAGATGT